MILDLFRKNYPGFPKGKIIASESPDFLIKPTPKKAIGLELCSLPSTSYTIKNKIDYQLLISDIHRSILKKEEKIRKYQKQHAGEYWLILYIDSIDPGNFNLNNHLEKMDMGAAFDRVFLFDLFYEKIY